MKADLETPRRLHQLVSKYPGIHLRELARLAGFSEAHTLNHVNRLVESGELREEADANLRRFYVPAPELTEADQGVLRLLRRRIPLQIALLLLDRQRAAFHEVVEELALAKSTVHYHLAQLEQAGLIERDTDESYALSDSHRVERVLIRWKPTTDLTGRFAEIWGGFFGRRGRGRKQD